MRLAIKPACQANESLIQGGNSYLSCGLLSPYDMMEENPLHLRKLSLNVLD